MTTALERPALALPDFGREIEQDILLGLTREHEIYGLDAALTIERARQLTSEYKSYWAQLHRAGAGLPLS